MRTLEQLYNELEDAGDGPNWREYDRRRREKIDALEAYIHDYLAAPDFARFIAGGCITCCEGQGRVDGDCYHGEVPSHYLRDGSPLVYAV